MVALSARTIVRNRDWKDAETFWAVTARDAPRCARAQYNVGFLLALRGRSEEAIAPLRAAVDIRGDTLERYALGCALLDVGREAEGRRELGKALAIARTEDDPSVSCGTILVALGRHVEALLQFEAELRRRPWNQRPRFQKGLCHEAMGDSDAALREYEQLLAAMPGHQAALLRAAELADRRGEKQRAARWRAMAEERAPPGN
jgi:tetratricopeptide (TPR) repeat protein